MRRKDKDINQKLVDETFRVRIGNCGAYAPTEDVKLIKDALDCLLGIKLSVAETIDFWKWRSEQWDMSWATPAGGKPEEIADFFDEFIDYVGAIDEEADDLCQHCDVGDEAAQCSCTTPATKHGVKVIVADSDDVPWEIELDADYHTQLLNQLEQQTPEKTVGQTLRYTLEYDPKKILKCTKLDTCQSCSAPAQWTRLTPPDVGWAIGCTKCNWRL